MGWFKRLFGRKPDRYSQPPPLPSGDGLPLSLFQPGYLSRVVPGAALEEVTFAALDFETTGLDPQRGHRVCEVAVVRFRGDGTVIEEYATLVDPRRSISPEAAENNGLSDEDVRGAPTFEEVWPDVLAMLAGSVVLAHNLEFEDKFLAAELRRMDQPVPLLAGVCSMVTCRAQLDGRSYKLQSLYRTATGHWITDAHTALGDCRALASLLSWLHSQSPEPLRYYGTSPAHDDDGHEPGRIVPRAERLPRHTDGYLGALAKRFPYTGVTFQVAADASERYAEALDETISDERITAKEAWHLEHLAREAGFSQQRLAAAHREAWGRATANLPIGEPDRLTDAQCRRLRQLAHDLGHPGLAAHLPDRQTRPDTTHLKGWRVGLDGDQAVIAELSELVSSNGGSVAKRLTGTVRFVAAAEPAADTPQLVKARELELPIVSLEQGRKQLATAIDDAAAEARQQRREVERAEADRAAWEAEREAYFRHTWRNPENNPEWGWGRRAVVDVLPRN